MPLERPPFDTIALVLQGGGALGAYQAGVMEGLADAGIEPDWVAGISIGAINAALIAGNAPADRIERLREFWRTVSQPAVWPDALSFLDAFVEPADGLQRQLWNNWSAWRALTEGQRGFFTPRPATAFVGSQPPDAASFYDTAPLKATLERLVDFDRINAGEMRLTVSAVDVETGNFEAFDNQHGRWRKRIRAEHIMASGALPPGFPAVAIEEPGPLEPSRASGAPRRLRHFWDGGLVSNTPLSQVLDDHPRRDTLAFQVDLWSARGKLPTNVIDAQERVKDIQYSSRTRAITHMQATEQRSAPDAARTAGADPAGGTRPPPGRPRGRAAGHGAQRQRHPADLPGQGVGRPVQGLRVRRRHDAQPLGQRAGGHQPHAGASALAGAPGGRRSVRDARHPPAAALRGLTPRPGWIVRLRAG